MLKIKKKNKETHYKLNVMLMLIGLILAAVGAVVYEDMLPIGIGSILFSLNLLTIMIKFKLNSEDANYTDDNLW